MAKTSATPNFDRINPAFCFNGKLRKLHRLVNTAYMAKLKPYGIRGSMLSILFIVGKRKHINQKTIAEMLVLDASTMSRDLKKLREKGYVISSRGQDSRNVMLELTDEGKAFLEEVIPIWEELHNRMEQVLGLHNIRQIDNLIEAVKSNMEYLAK